MKRKGESENTWVVSINHLDDILRGLNKMDDTDQKFLDQILTLINLHIKRKEGIKGTA